MCLQCDFAGHKMKVHIFDSEWNGVAAILDGFFYLTNLAFNQAFVATVSTFIDSPIAKGKDLTLKTWLYGVQGPLLALASLSLLPGAIVGFIIWTMTSFGNSTFFR